MGTTVSLSLDNNLNLNCFSIVFVSKDRMRLILAPEDVVKITKNVLSYHWKIIDTQTQGYVEFKLSGLPWYSTGSTNMDVKYFMCVLLKEYYAVGWHIKTGSDIHKECIDTNVLFFERKAPLFTNVICLSLNDSDKISVLAPDDIIPTVRQVIVNSWPYGIQDEQDYGKGIEYKLKGDPWTDEDGEKSYYTPVLLNQLLYALRGLGWIFCSAIDTSKSQSGLNAIYLRNVNEDNKQEIMDRNERIFSISLHKTDRIRVIGGNDAIIALVGDIISKTWFKGTQEEKPVHNSYEFKLKGNPWSDSGEESVDARCLVNSMFHILRENGWELYAVTKLSKSASSKSTLFFRYTSIKPVNLRNFCLSLNDGDKIRVVDGDELLVDKIRCAIVMGWSDGIQNEKLFHNSFQFKLHKYPFCCPIEVQTYTIFMLLIILNSMNEMGINLIGSVDLSAIVFSDTDPVTGALRSLEKRSSESWFFQIDESIVSLA